MPTGHSSEPQVFPKEAAVHVRAHWDGTLSSGPSYLIIVQTAQKTQNWLFKPANQIGPSSEGMT